MDLKVCIKCGINKYLSEYGKKRNDCKKCHDDIVKLWIVNNRDRHSETRRKRRLLHKDQAKVANKRYREKNKEKALKVHTLWRKTNPDAWRKISNRSDTKRRFVPSVILSERISTGIRLSLVGGKKRRKWESMVDFTAEQLKTHIEKLFTDGMNWDNRNLWHIDHKVPISAFNFITYRDFDFKRCWGLDNLRPMWATENIKKGNRLPVPFQPSLLIELIESEHMAKASADAKKSAAKVKKPSQPSKPSKTR
jgi:hypothetical protein